MRTFPLSAFSAVLLLLLAFTTQTEAAKPKCNHDAADVVIVGGGLSGLTAAYKLKAAGKCVLVVEGSNNIGGLCRNWNIAKIRDFSQKKAPVVGTNVQVSVGGSYFDVDIEPTLMWLLKELKLNTTIYPSPPYNPLTAPAPLYYPPSLSSTKAADYSIFGTLLGIGLTYPNIKTAPQSVQQLQGLPIESYLASQFPNIAYNATAKQMIRDWAWSQENQELAKVDTYTLARYIATTVPYNAQTQSFPNGANPKLVYQLIGGTGQITAVLKQALMKMGVLAQVTSPVTKIDSRPNAKNVITITANSPRGKLTIIAREKVIVAVPPSNAGKIQYVPALLQQTTNVMKGYSTLDNVDYQVFAFFKTPWWYAMQPMRSPAIVPTYDVTAKFLADPKSAPRLFGYTAPVPPVISDTAASQGWGVLRIFVPKPLFRSSSSTLRKDVIDYLSFFNVTVPIDQLMDVKVYNWGTLEPFMNHYFINPGTLAGNLNNTYIQANGGGYQGNVVFAGTQTDPNWSFYLEGAVGAGVRAAAIALA